MRSWNLGSHNLQKGCSPCAAGTSQTEPAGGESVTLDQYTPTHTHIVQRGCAHQLQGCEVFFPPQVLLHVGADGSQAVVGVHDDVDEGVQQADEERCRRLANASGQ